MGVFCVDRETGDIIPETMKKANEIPPMAEYICQAYGEVCKYILLSFNKCWLIQWAE